MRLFSEAFDKANIVSWYEWSMRYVNSLTAGLNIGVEYVENCMCVCVKIWKIDEILNTDALNLTVYISY